MPVSERRSHFVQYRPQVLELLASKGFSQVGMRELASSLGLSPGALYHHYPSKQELLFDLIEELYEELLAAVASVRRAAVKKPEKLNLLIQVHLRLHAEMPWHLRLAERDIGCLTEEQQQRLYRLREDYEGGLYMTLGAPVQTVDPQAVPIARIIANLLQCAPAWLTGLALNQHQQHEFLQDFLTTAINKLLIHKRTSVSRLV
ncbi:TetR/AcrR family transcriptional regulator [Pseudomonas sp.]|uniref:TetR/AcrR family transcriptional regulator n=1 Tax=Pseudomonas sp. TaxID=306 RepID=UPI000F029DBA|nr:Nucleoid occlusion factor SlmA [Pseudomonas fluorescens]